MTKDNIPLLNLVINYDDNDINETLGLSFVSIPASLTEWLKFSDSNFKFKLDADQQIITAPMFRANFPIYRKIGSQEFNVQMDANSVKNLCLQFMKNGAAINKIDLNHNGKFSNYGFLFESYILTDKHKIDIPEFAELEEGSWIVSYKITDNELWKQIQLGKFSGISPEIPYSMVEIEKQNEYSDIINILY